MKRAESRTPVWLLALFFSSGLAGLGYQLIWTESFGAGIGHEFPATLAVITAFMTGMALGGLLFERLPDRWQRVPGTYGWLELIIGIWGLGTILLIPELNRAIIFFLGESPSTLRHWVVVFTGVFVGLLPATAAMGATLPSAQTLLLSLTARRWTGILYGANTAGAMLGALLAAFWLMRKFGLGNSTVLFSSINFGCGFAALALARKCVPVPREKRARESVPSHALAVRLFTAGALGIGFETLMIRALAHFLESTVYTFAVVLAVYLLGNALGAAAYQRLLKRVLRVETLFGSLAFSCAFSAILLRWLPAIYPPLRRSFGDSIAAVAFAEYLTAALVFLLPAFLMGMIFSALADASLESRRSLGWSVACNSLGSAVGAVLFGLFFLPLLGLRLASGGIVLGYASLAGNRARWFLPACAILAPLFTPGPELILHPEQKIAFFNQGQIASVAVLESTNHARVLKVNNRFQMGGTAARVAEERHADIPILLHPNPRRALFIGLGTGITFATAVNYPRLVAEAVELLPAVVEAMSLFQSDPEVLRNPALRVHVGDGRRFVLTTQNRYDVIVGDLFHPAQDGTAFLYTLEQFRAVRDRLTPEGLFCQWLPIYQMDNQTVDTIANTFKAVFPYAEMWLLRFNVDTPAIALIGWMERPRIAPNSVEAKVVASERLREHLRTVALGDTLRLFGCRLGDLRGGSSGKLNTDRNPIVLFEAPSVTFQQRDDPAARLMKLIARYAERPLEPLLESPDPAFISRLSAYSTARNIYLRGLVEERRGDLVAAVNEYVESARLSPEFTSGYAEALGIATTLSRGNPEAAGAILRRLMEAQPERPVARQLWEKLANPH